MMIQQAVFRNDRLPESQVSRDSKSSKLSELTGPSQCSGLAVRAGKQPWDQLDRVVKYGEY